MSYGVGIKLGRFARIPLSYKNRKLSFKCFLRLGKSRGLIYQKPMKSYMILGGRYLKNNVSLKTALD